jgi:hypothetical protein
MIVVHVVLQLKQMALVLLKRNVVALWEQVGVPGQEEVKEKLLALLSIQLPGRVLSILTNTIAAVALAISDKGGERGVPETLEACVFSCGGASYTMFL